MLNKLQNLQETISQHREQLYQLQFLLKHNVKHQQQYSESASIKQILNDFQGQSVNFDEISYKQVSSHQNTKLNANHSQIILKIIKKLSYFFEQLHQNLNILKYQIEIQHKLLFRELKQQLGNFTSIIYRNLIEKNKFELSNHTLSNQDCQNTHFLCYSTVCSNYSSLSNSCLKQNNNQNQSYIGNEDRLKPQMSKNTQPIKYQRFSEGMYVIKEDASQWEADDNNYYKQNKHTQQSVSKSQIINFQFFSHKIKSPLKILPFKAIEIVEQAQIPQIKSIQKEHPALININNYPNQQLSIKINHIDSINKFYRDQISKQNNDSLWKEQKIKILKLQLNKLRKKH